MTLIGTAVAFLVGFQNNSAYGRIWEARMILGAIVNTSRTWVMKVQDMVTNEYCDDSISEDELKLHKKTLIYPHIAWVTALRYAMRQKKSWETQHSSKTNREWSKIIHPREQVSALDDNLIMYLSEEER